MNVETFFTQTLRPETEHIVRVTTAVVLGGLIGLERELRDKPAGFRTIILICVGACVFTIVSLLAGGPDNQHTRIAAQVVTGIGFLGAGAILRERANVLGLTTAATIWSVAAVGMAVGFGYLGLGVLAAGVILVALFLFDIVEHWIGEVRDIQEFHIATANTDDAFDVIAALFKEARLSVRKQSAYQDGDCLVVDVIAMGAKANHDRLRIKLARSERYTLRKG